MGKNVPQQHLLSLNRQHVLIQTMIAAIVIVGPQKFLDGHDFIVLIFGAAIFRQALFQLRYNDVTISIDHSQPDSSTVQRHGQLLDLQHIMWFQGNNVCADIVFVYHQSFLLQAIDGFPDRRAAHTDFIL